jgi:hypothetical protein
LAPPQLAPRVHSLPPILHMRFRNSLSSYSKGARGLSVWPRVEGIFTPNAISLSPWLRQWGNRYAIHAGRNLPDKEFRYLRTVHSCCFPHSVRAAESFPLGSPCCHGDRTISSPLLHGVWRVVSEDSRSFVRIFSSLYFLFPPSFMSLRASRILLMPSSVRCSPLSTISAI